MQRSTLLTLFGLLVLGFLVWYAFSHPLSPTPSAPSAATTTMASYAEDEPYYTIEAHWPQATGLQGDGDPAAVLLMKNWVQDTILEFKKNGNYTSLTPDIEMSGFREGMKHALDIMYLTSSSSRTLSHIFTVYMNTGGAHPNSYFHTFVFDTETGARLALKDLFEPGSPYLATLSSVSRSKLPGVIGEFADEEYIAEGTGPREENFQNFFFDGEDFVLLFPPYQVGPYALGPVTLTLRTNELPTMKAQYR